MKIGRHTLGLILAGMFLGCGSGGPTESNALSHDATLKSMTMGAVSLTPAFSTAIYAYTASVGTVISSVAVTPTAWNDGATITVNGTSVLNGHESGTVPLAIGDNTITVLATAADGLNTKTYVIAVHRSSLTGGIRSAPMRRATP